jgi:hypothetical protein
VSTIARQECLQLLVDHLGSTRPGRDLGIERLRSLDDLRASVRIRSPRRHHDEVETKWGFGVFEAGDGAVDLGGGSREREHVVGIWRSYLDGGAPERVALLRGHHFDSAVDDIILDDLRTWGEGGELRRIARLDDPADVLDQLEEYQPDVLVVPSALTCLYLENQHRAPLETRLTKLRLILAEHDLRRPVRTVVKIRSAGWIDRTGRVAVATARPPDHAVTLATSSQIVELLPYSNPEDDGRRVYAMKTVLPEHAIVGQRYEVTCTSPLGFLRLRTGEHVRVVGFDAPAPGSPFARPRVVRLSPAPADVRLEGCTVAGSWLTASVRQALAREDPALVQAEIGADPMSIPTAEAAVRTASMRLHEAFADTELGGLSRTGAIRSRRRRPRSLLVRIELQGFVNNTLGRRLSERIDANLRQRSEAYAHLRARDDLQPPRVQVVSAGSRQQDEQRRVARLDGGVWVPEVRVVTDP